MADVNVENKYLDHILVLRTFGEEEKDQEFPISFHIELETFLARRLKMAVKSYYSTLLMLVFFKWLSKSNLRTDGSTDAGVLQLAGVNVSIHYMADITHITIKFSTPRLENQHQQL